MRSFGMRSARLAQDQAHQIHDAEGVPQLATTLRRQTLDIDRIGKRHTVFGIDELLLEHGSEQAPVRRDDGVYVLRREGAVGTDGVKPPSSVRGCRA